MVQGIKHILFTSDLSEISRQAFNYAAMLAMQFKCKISLLHIIEDLPHSVEAQLQVLFGKSEWAEILSDRKQTAQDLLVGKLSKVDMIRAALSQFCQETGIDADECGVVDYDIIVTEGDVANSILAHATELDCDLVVMGASKGILNKSSIGSKIKSVMKKADVPVMVVPHAE
jgi:nucleotide-binding universal stress UspA family protein